MDTQKADRRFRDIRIIDNSGFRHAWGKVITTNEVFEYFLDSGDTLCSFS